MLVNCKCVGFVGFPFVFVVVVVVVVVCVCFQLSVQEHVPLTGLHVFVELQPAPHASLQSLP